MTRSLSTSKFHEARRRAGVLTLLLVVAAATIVPWPSDAAVDLPGYTPIQPGAAVTVYPGDAYPKAVLGTPFAVCTLNFVFRDDEHTYIGDAGHCVQSVGQRIAAPGIGEFGTVAFRVSCRITPCDNRPVVDDFALIRVDEDKLDMVSPVMRGLGTPPSGFTTSDETSTGDLVLVHGQGAPFSLAEPGRTQPGVLEHDDALSFATTLQGPGNSGSPVVRLQDGKALGIIAATRTPAALAGTPADMDAPLQGGPTVEHIMDLLAASGFDVHLVTEEVPGRGCKVGHRRGRADPPRRPECPQRA